MCMCSHDNLIRSWSLWNHTSIENYGFQRNSFIIGFTNPHCCDLQVKHRIMENQSLWGYTSSTFVQSWKRRTLSLYMKISIEKYIQSHIVFEKYDVTKINHHVNDLVVLSMKHFYISAYKSKTFLQIFQRNIIYWNNV